MRILIDENVPRQLIQPLAAGGHRVDHVNSLGWKGTSNGELLRRAVEGGYEALLTGDAAIAAEQNIAAYDLALLVLVGGRTRDRVTAAAPQILEIGIGSSGRGDASTPLGEPRIPVARRAPAALISGGAGRLELGDEPSDGNRPTPALVVMRQ